MTSENDRTSAAYPAGGLLNQAPRDAGSALPLVLVMMVIGALIVLPLMSYSITVMRANTVLSAKTQRYEAVKAGLRTSLYNPLEVYRHCDLQGQAKDLNSIEINDVEVNSTCQIVGNGTTVVGDHRRFGLAATEKGQTIPVELKGNKFAGAPTADAWLGLLTPLYENPGDPDQWDKIWLPMLPPYPETVRSAAGHTMPSDYLGCKVYFPGTYKDDLPLSGKVFFASGIYYFEGIVSVLPGAEVTVGDGRSKGCATSQDAVFHAEPPVEAHNITGFGATWLFGGNGRLEISNADGQPVAFQMNRRYVDETSTDPSLYLSIASVNGAIGGVDGGLLVDGMINVPESDVLIGKAPDGTPITASAPTQGMTPSTLTSAPRPPGPPVNVSAVAFRNGGTPATNGVYITWAPPATANGSPIERYEVVQQSPAPTAVRCSVTVLSGLPLECLVTGLGSSAGIEYEFQVVAYSAAGASTPAPMTSPAAKIWVKTGTSGSPTQTPAHVTLNAPSVPTITRYNGAARASWTPPTYGSPNTPIVRYTVSAQSRTPAVATPATPAGPATPVGNTCQTLTRAATSCIVPGLNPTLEYQFRVTTTNLGGTTSSPSAWTSTWVRPNSGTAPSPDPNNPAPPAPLTTLPSVPQYQSAPIVDVNLPSTTAGATIRIPGYIVVPQGKVRMNNPIGHPIQVIGGILAARFDVVDGRRAVVPASNPVTYVADSVPLGFESEMVQVKLRIVSTTPAGNEASVAVVQINENGAYSVNSWEVQS